MALYTAQVNVPSRTETATGADSGVFAAGIARTLNVAVTVSARSGTAPTFTTKVEWSFDGGTTFIDLGDSVAQNAVGSAGVSAPVRAPHYRIAWTIGGTAPSYTFSVRSYASK